MSGQINVEVDARPQQDLSAVMAEIREQYEGVAAKNRKELEGWYQTKARTDQNPNCFPATGEFCSLKDTDNILFCTAVRRTHQGGGSQHRKYQHIQIRIDRNPPYTSGPGDRATVAT